MRRSRRRVRIFGLLSVAPIVVVVAYVPFAIVWIARGEQSGLLPAALLGLVVGSVLAAYAMTIVYAIDVFRNPRVSEDMRAAWLVLLILLNAWVVPVYWYRHVRPTAVTA
jgi:hypothetical protein